MLADIACRKAVLKAAVSSKLKGGTSRVLVRPGLEVLAITATPHDGSGASMRNGLFMSGTFACLVREGRRNEDAHRFSACCHGDDVVGRSAQGSIRCKNHSRYGLHAFVMTFSQ